MSRCRHRAGPTPGLIRSPARMVATASRSSTTRRAEAARPICGRSNPARGFASPAPETNFPVDYGRPEYALIAGGIGITPLVRHGVGAGAARGAPEAALLRAQRRRSLLLPTSCEARSASGWSLTSRASGSISARYCQRYSWRACHGVRPPADARRGAPHLEEPRPPDDGSPVRDVRLERHHAPEAFRVRLPQLNREIVVPENQSMLDALESAGIGVVSDCRRGECGVCAINVIGVEGTVDHRDVFFSERRSKPIQKSAPASRARSARSFIDPLYRPDAERRPPSAKENARR